MRPALLVCILCLIGGTACPALLPAVTGAPASLPDLYILQDGIQLTVADTETPSAPVGTAVVNVTVHIGNKGPGNLTSANVTLTINGTPYGVSPVLVGYGGVQGAMAAVFSWNTGELPTGTYPVLAVVNDSAGDANPLDNSMETNFTIAPHAPGFNLALDSAVVEAAITESAPGEVNLTGNITVADLYGQTLRIVLTSSTDIGWVTSVTSTVNASVDGRYPITASVRVPQGTSASQLGKLTVFASARALGEELGGSVEALVTVRPYFRLTMYTSQPAIEITPGSSCTFTIRLTNAGNANDSYSLEVRNLNELVADREMATLSRLTLDRVRASDFASFDVVFRSAEDWTLSKDETTTIVIRATSEGATQYKQTVALNFPIYVHEKGSYPAGYNLTTISATTVTLAVVLVVGLVVWRQKKKNVPPSEEE